MFDSIVRLGNVLDIPVGSCTAYEDPGFTSKDFTVSAKQRSSLFPVTSNPVFLGRQNDGDMVWGHSTTRICIQVVEWPLSKQRGDLNSNHFKSLSFQVKVAGSQITILLSYVALDLEFSNQTTKQSIEALLEGLSNSPSLSQNLKNYLNRLFPTKKQQLVNKQRRLVGLIYVNF